MRPVVQLASKDFHLTGFCRKDGSMILRSRRTDPATDQGNCYFCMLLMSAEPECHLTHFGEICQRHHLLFYCGFRTDWAGIVPVGYGKNLVYWMHWLFGHKRTSGTAGDRGFLVSPGIGRADGAVDFGWHWKCVSHTEKRFRIYAGSIFESGTPNLPGIYGLHEALLLLNAQPQVLKVCSPSKKRTVLTLFS